MSMIQPSPGPVARPRSQPSGPADARPAGPAGTRPSGGAGERPHLRAAPPPAAGSAAHRRRLVTAFVELFLEVEAGRRPPAQLKPLLEPMLYARLTRVWHRGGRVGQVVSVSVVGTDIDRFDAIAVVRRGPRAGAVSLRLARRDGRWRIQELARPEDGALPGPAHPIALDDDGGDGGDDAEIPQVVLREGSDRAARTRSDEHRQPPPADADWLVPVPTG